MTMAGRRSRRPSDRPLARWLRFNLVGVGGFVVQLSALAALTRVVRLPVAAGVALAVLAAVAHNFYWHERYTWRRSAPGRAARFLAFAGANGALSLVSNIVMTTALTSLTGLPVLPANGIAVACTSLLTFAIADRAIFRLRESRPPAAPASPARVSPVRPRPACDDFGAAAREA